MVATVHPYWRYALIPILILMSCGAMTDSVPSLELIAKLDFQGPLHEAEDLSAIASLYGGLLVGADEGHRIQFLTPTGNNAYQVDQDLILNDDPDTETDIEDICCMGNTCYVVGSHSRKRKKTKPDEDRTENKKRLYEPVKREPDREALYQVKMKNGELVQTDKLSLYDLIKDDDLLKPFLSIASKENGIDIEGIAILKDELYVGFRSPILRENYVPILRVNVDKLDKPKLKFIQMGGRGIRAMAETDDGILILGGPPGDGDMSYQLYFWDGKNMLRDMSKDVSQHLQLLGTVPVDKGAKAEGLTILSSQENAWEILVIYDGISGGKPSIFKAERL